MKHLLLPLLAAASVSFGVSQAQVYKFTVSLDGAQEFPGPGDPDGSGIALLYLDAAASSITWDITVLNIDFPITGDHIHQGVAGASGPVVINFSGALVGGPLVDPDVAAVLANPTGYYVNVHNASFPGGAVRGQLGQGVLVPEASGSTALVAGAVLGGLGWRSRRRRMA
jgi:hypothetical protein